MKPTVLLLIRSIESLDLLLLDIKVIISVLHHLSPLLIYFIKSCHLDDDIDKTAPTISVSDVKWSIDVGDSGCGQWIERQLQSINAESLEILRHQGKQQITRSSYDLYFFI